MTDAIGGQVPVAIGTVFLVNPHVKAGKVKALAVTSPKPSPQMPGVATVAEQGVPGFSALSWWGSSRRPNAAADRERMYEELQGAEESRGREEAHRAGHGHRGRGPAASWTGSCARRSPLGQGRERKEDQGGGLAAERGADS